jgi:uncharacterized repeat protein (TIGR01451 family)
VTRVSSQAALCAVVCGVFGGASSALAQSMIYVATTGTDSSSCGLVVAAPCRTIGYAYTNRATSGDTINVAAGQYGSSNPYETDANPANGKYLFIKKTIHFVGAQAGVDARTRPVGGLGETVIYNDLPNNASAELWYIAAPGVTVDGFTFDDVTPGPGHYELQNGGAGIQTKNELGKNLMYPVESDGWRITNTIFHMTDIGLYAASAGNTQSVAEHDLFDDSGGNVPSNVGDAGIYSDHPLINTLITQNLFVGDKIGNPVLIATAYTTPSSHLTISENVMDGQGSVSLYRVTDATISDNSMRGVYRGVAADGDDHQITISDNKITEPNSVEPSLRANCVQLSDTYATGQNSEITIFDNIMVGCVTGGVRVANTDNVVIDYNVITGTRANAVEIVPNTDSYLPPGAPPPVTTGVAILRNTITRSTGFGVSVASGSYSGRLLARYNRIVDNGSYDGLRNDDESASIDARWNWWGCNTPKEPQPPTSPGCGTVKGSATSAVTWDPWLVLTIASDPADIPAQSAAAIISTVHTDSNGADTPGLPTSPSPYFRHVPDRFTAAVGSVRPAIVELTTGLNSDTRWPAGQVRPTIICSTVDHQTVCLTWPPIVINKISDSPQVQPGGLAGYRITVRNLGRVAAWNVGVCDQSPQQLRFVKSTRRLRARGRRLCLVLPRIAPRQRVSFGVTFRVASDSPQGAVIENTAEASPNVIAPQATGKVAKLTARTKVASLVTRKRPTPRPPPVTG